MLSRSHYPYILFWMVCLNHLERFESDFRQLKVVMAALGQCED